jgi:hypothetical protein
MIDVHIIDDPAHAEWQAQAMESIPLDICNLKMVPRADRSIAENRLLGFEGEAPYISYVDGDDCVLHGAFEKCLDFLEHNSDIDVVGTLENQLFGHEILSPDVTAIAQMIAEDPFHVYGNLHHLIVIRREAYETCKIGLTKHRHCERGLLKELFDQGHKAHLILEPGYIWRQHDDSYSASIRNENG